MFELVFGNERKKLEFGLIEVISGTTLAGSTPQLVHFKI